VVKFTKLLMYDTRKKIMVGGGCSRVLLGDNSDSRNKIFTRFNWASLRISMKRFTPFKWVFVVFFAVLLAFFWASAVSAMDLEVTGAGNSGANGCYDETVPGHTWVNVANSDYIIDDVIDPSRCYIADTTPTFDGLYYGGASMVGCISSAVAAGYTWTTASGPGPAPTLTQTTCASPPDNTPTSTIEQTQQNLSTAIYIFLGCMFGMLWLMRKH